MFGLDDRGHPGACGHMQPPRRVAFVLSEGQIKSLLLEAIALHVFNVGETVYILLKGS